MTFLKNDPRPCATLKQVFLDRFGLVVAHFGTPKIPKCLETGLFWDQKWVKNGSKTHFSRPHPRPFGVHKRGEAKAICKLKRREGKTKQTVTFMPWDRDEAKAIC